MATGTGTSLTLIAVGAVLAFAVSFQIVGINIATIGAILMIVGIIGLVISVATIAGYAPWGANRERTRQNGQTQGVAAQTAPSAPQTAPVAPQAPVTGPQATIQVVAAPAGGASPDAAPVAAPASATEVATPTR